MRTTLNLDDDVLVAARAISAQRGQPIGVVISGLLRERLVPEAAVGDVRNGIRLFPRRPDEAPVTPELIKRLLLEEE